jgi:hypothetical protein
MKLAPLVLAGLIAAAPALAQTPDPARLALARQVVGLLFSGQTFSRASANVAETSLKIVEAQTMMAEVEAQPETDAPTPPPAAPKFDDKALRASLERAIEQLVPRYEESIAGAYADAFTADQLSGMLAFFTSPGGAAAIRHRAAYAEAPQPQAHPYVEAAPEAAFDKSPPGQALKAHQLAIGQHMEELMRTLWPQAMAAAQTDYCARQPCGDPERAVFAGLGKIWDQTATP